MIAAYDRICPRTVVNNLLEVDDRSNRIQYVAIRPRWRRKCCIQNMSHCKPPHCTGGDDWSLDSYYGTRHTWQRSDVCVVLVHPQIPQNVGNIARTCAATGVPLHLVGPLGFEIDDRKLKRAGLDYWSNVTVRVWDSFDLFYSFFKNLPESKRIIAFSKFGKVHFAAKGIYCPGEQNWLMFGAETTGLPGEAHAAAETSGGRVVKIPIANQEYVRSLNLATCTGIGIFEALRQLDGAVLPENINN